MLELCTLASGSSGNSLLVTDGRTHVLVDAGISCRRICTGLKELGVEPTELAGVLITHEHSDHISGLTTLTKQLRLPVYARPGTGRQLCYRIAFLEELLRPVAPGEGFSIGGKTATSQTLPRSDHKYISSFLGFAPADNPQVLVLVVINNPQGIYYGGTIAAPVAKEIFENILPYLDK